MKQTKQVGSENSDFLKEMIHHLSSQQKLQEGGLITLRGV